MCGIAGAFSKNHSIDSTILHAMLDIASHRGPDDKGVFISENKFCGIGMNRLSIIDLSNGNQPIWNEDKSLVMVCNGEIYNHISLREELQEKGHQFATESDVEVVMHIYEEEGLKGFNRLDGMFALAIYAPEKSELVLARDRYGIKPLYISNNQSETFYFGSEPKSILAVNESKEVRDSVVLEHLVWGYSRKGLPIWKSLDTLPKGHYLVKSDSTTFVESYLEYSGKEEIKDFEEAKGKIRSEMIKSVESQLMSEVPLGVFLSGGIDSSIIVGIVTKILGKEVKTFSIDFEGERYSEADKIDHVSNLYNTDHLTFRADKDILKYHEQVIKACDEPFGDPAALPTFYLCEQTVKHVTVSLSGDGSDEFQYGYAHHLKVKDKYAFLRSSVLHKIALNLPHWNPKVYSLISRTAPRKSWPSNLYFIMKFRLFQGGGDLSHPEHSSFESYERNSYLENDILIKTDRMSMYHSLEARVPFLANDLIDLVKQVPKQFQLLNGIGKSALRAAFPDLLDEKIMHQKKHGFTTPVGDWIRESYSEQEFSAYVFNSGLKELLKKKAIQSMIMEHFSHSYDHGKFLYRLLTVAKWDYIYKPKYG